jgi:hypothetical protein
VHVCMAPSDGGPRLTLPRLPGFPRTRSTLLAALVLCCCHVACHRQTGTPGPKFEWTFSPAHPTVGSAVLHLEVDDAAGRPLSGANLRIEAHMTHPGMAPEITSATEGALGSYEAALQFTMPGAWLLIVTGTSPSGESFRYQIDLPHVPPG